MMILFREGTKRKKNRKLILFNHEFHIGLRRVPRGNPEIGRWLIAINHYNRLYIVPFIKFKWMEHWNPIREPYHYEHSISAIWGFHRKAGRIEISVSWYFSDYKHHGFRFFVPFYIRKDWHPYDYD